MRLRASEMGNVYDMVSSEWLVERNSRSEATPSSIHPKKDTDMAAPLLVSHPVAISCRPAMPVDLASVNLNRFLNRQTGSGGV